MSAIKIAPSRFTPDLATVLGYMEACERTAESSKEGMTAFRTWCLASVCGWDTTRLRLSQSTWYRHVAICRQAGLPVPARTPRLRRLEFGSGWFGTTSGEELIVFISNQPGYIHQLANKGFQVVRTWDEFYPKGTKGRVLCLKYQTGGWYVECMLDGSPGGNESVTLHHFLHSTQPVEYLDYE